MALTSLTFTLCVSSRRYQVDDLVSLVDQTPNRSSPASTLRDDHRAFWDLGEATASSVEDLWPAAVAWATRYAEAFKAMEDARVTLWCTAESDSEFAGFALQAKYLEALGISGIDLVISAYTQHTGVMTSPLAP
jgi:hypothetical protein